MTIKKIFLLPVKNLRSVADKYEEALKKNINLQKELLSANNDLKTSYHVLQKILYEIILHGASDHLNTYKDDFEKDVAQSRQNIAQITNKINQTEKEVHKLSVEYDHRLNRFGIISTIINTLFVATFVFYIVSLYGAIRNYSPELADSIGIAALNIDKDFYDISAQLIMALTVALFIGKKTLKLNNTPWWNYARFASGVSWALAGMATCMYVLAGNEPGIYTISLVLVSEIILIYTAIKPLAMIKK